MIFGIYTFGWVDRMRGVGTVGTRFVHLMFFPLVPLQSLVKIDPDRAIAIPLNGKSVLKAWFCACCAWVALFSLASGVSSGGDLRYVMSGLVAVGAYVGAQVYTLDASPETHADRGADRRTAATSPTRT